MTTTEVKTSVSFVPLLIGICLWASGTALLLEDAWHAQRFTVETMSVPILTAATVASACLAHKRLAAWRVISAAGFAVLALLGSTVLVGGTLGRVAETRDGKEATVGATNRGYGMKSSELADAKVSAKAECRVMGPRCTQWQARVDTLTKELAGIVVRSTDPKADSIARLATLLGGNGARVKEIVQAFDPILLPAFLEFGSVLFFAAAFPTRRRKVERVAGPVTLAVETPATPARVAKVFSRDDALADFLTLKASNSQSFLADRWLVSEGTVSKWLSGWETDGRIERKRTGRSMSTALAPPARKALPAR